jgi:hypothetical protein
MAPALDRPIPVFRAKTAEIERLLFKLSTLYDDPLDGRISPMVYDQKAAMIESQQSDLHRKILELESATLPPLMTAIEIARLTSHACTAFRDQTEPEQRKLLRLVVKNATWKDGEFGPCRSARLPGIDRSCRRSNCR